MYLVLLVFGAVLAAAGLVIGTSGVSIHDRAFDASLLTPGVIAAVGGLIVIGVGLALRTLQRIEFALATRPMPRAVRADDASVIAASPELPAEPQPIALPAKPDVPPQAVAAPAQPAEARTIEPARLRLPTLAALAGAEPAPRLDGAPAKPQPQLRSEKAVGEPGGERPVMHRTNGGPAKIAPRLDATSHPAPPNEQAPGPAFDTFWPKGPRPRRPAQPAPAPATSAAQSAQSGVSAFEAPAIVAQDDGAAPLSVLKSGVVDGMAYTLFSDGSIEAQLPQGTLRFGSITELRHHIEQTPPDVAAS